jgi:hypothetical protein
MTRGNEIRASQVSFMLYRKKGIIHFPSISSESGQYLRLSIRISKCKIKGKTRER